MKMMTPEGERDVVAMNYVLEKAEVPIRVTLEDGAVLQWRAMVGGVYTWTDKDGEARYVVQHLSSVVKLT